MAQASEIRSGKGTALADPPAASTTATEPTTPLVTATATASDDDPASPVPNSSRLVSRSLYGGSGNKPIYIRAVVLMKLRLLKVISRTSLIVTYTWGNFNNSLNRPYWLRELTPGTRHLFLCGQVVKQKRICFGQVIISKSSKEFHGLLKILKVFFLTFEHDSCYL